VVGAVLLSWVVGATVVASRRRATRAVGLDAEPLLFSAQDIFSSLAAADATAANAFLAGGIEPADQRRAYLDDIQRASGGIADASMKGGSSGRGRAALTTLARQLPVYTGLVEAARADNRQGLPAGAAFLREASTLMRQGLLPAAQALYETEATQLGHEYGNSSEPLQNAAIVLIALLLLGALIVPQLYLVQRTNRVINVPLLLATLVAVGLLGWVLVAFAGERNDLATAKRQGSDPVQVLSQARILALRAKGAESLSLVARGSGQAFDADFAAFTTSLGVPDGYPGVLARARALASTSQSRQAAAAVDDAFTAYLTVHKKVTDLVSSGRFAEAVALAVGPRPDQVNATFKRLDSSLDQALTLNQAEFARRAAAGRHQLDGLSTAIPLGLVLAGLLALAGLQQRINDYR
jgi:hypothetical protein